MIQQLRDTANEDQYCGQSCVIDRKVISDTGKTISTYAVATNIAQYDGLPSKTSDISELTNKVNEGREKTNLDSGIDIPTSSVPAKKVRVH